LIAEKLLWKLFGTPSLEKYVRRGRRDDSESRRFLAAKRDTNQPAASRKSLRCEINFAGI
jgi:hypothetical protein